MKTNSLSKISQVTDMFYAMHNCWAGFPDLVHNMDKPVSYQTLQTQKKIPPERAMMEAFAFANSILDMI